MIELDTIKELFKEAIDESDNMSEAVQKLFGKVYDKGKETTSGKHKGHWVKRDTMGLPEVEKIECSECGESIVKGMDIKAFKHCPWCGAEMESEE